MSTDNKPGVLKKFTGSLKRHWQDEIVPAIGIGVTVYFCTNSLIVSFASVAGTVGVGCYLQDVLEQKVQKKQKKQENGPAPQA